MSVQSTTDPGQRLGTGSTEIPATPATDGILVVNKPEDISSAAVVKMVKRLPGVKKAGHTGTLDPFATGVLICPVNRATRLSRFFLQGSKKYCAVMTLGKETDTLDCTGKTTALCPVPELSRETIIKTINEFAGEIQQLPPAYSALKHNGIPLYKYAREGRPVQKPARSVFIENIQVTRVKLPEIKFEVTCSAGTYIRSLCADIGKKLGCGGHLSRLTRTGSSGFSITGAVETERLRQIQTSEELNQLLIPMAEAIGNMPAIFADTRLSEKIRHGRPLSADDLEVSRQLPAAGLIRILDEKNRLIAVIEGRMEKNSEEVVWSYCCVFHYT
jgi:tRNA pseudouridine55 synthase